MPTDLARDKDVFALDVAAKHFGEHLADVRVVAVHLSCVNVPITHAQRGFDGLAYISSLDAT